MKKFKSIITKLAVALVAAVSLVACRHEASAAVYESISLPSLTFPGGNYDLGGTAANTSTNLGLGWSEITTNVAARFTFTNGVGGWSTNTTYTTNTRYADFDALGRRYVVLQLETTASGSSASNVVLTVSRSVTGSRYATVDTILITNTATAATPAVKLYQIDMGGYPYGRISNLAWNSTNAAQTVTNRLYFSTQETRQGAASAN